MKTLCSFDELEFKIFNSFFVANGGSFVSNGIAWIVLNLIHVDDITMLADIVYYNMKFRKRGNVDSLIKIAKHEKHA